MHSHEHEVLSGLTMDGPMWSGVGVGGEAVGQNPSKVALQLLTYTVVFSEALW